MGRVPSNYRLAERKPIKLVSAELLPCPFCGSEAELYGDCDMVWVRCSNDNCRAERITRFDEPEDAIQDWNCPTSKCRGQQNDMDCRRIRRIDDLGRIAIPKHIRQFLKISEGDKLVFILYPRGVYIKPIEKEMERDG